jgi:hypothetical protein
MCGVRSVQTFPKLTLRTVTMDTVWLMHASDSTLQCIDNRGILMHLALLRSLNKTPCAHSHFGKACNASNVQALLTVVSSTSGPWYSLFGVVLSSLVDNRALSAIRS